MLTTEVAWSQIIGTRKSQQDSAGVVSWPNGFRLLLLADGMGGHVGGDIASSLVIDKFKEYFISSDQSDMRTRMIDSLSAANIEIYNKVKEEPDLSGMGTTLIALVFDGLSIQWISVGDSPMWLIRNDKIERINENHSMSEVLAEKVAAGEITQEEANTSPTRSQLLEAVMGENIDRLDAPESSMDLQEGDCLILASDGVESCRESEILSITQTPSITAEQSAIDILNAVTNIGKRSQDNASLVIMQVTTNELNEPLTVQPEGDDLVIEARTEQ